MHRNSLKKLWIHIVLWGVMLFYVVVSPDVALRLFKQHGKPAEVNANIPVESDRIKFVVEDLLSYLKDGENLYQLYGWAFILPEKDTAAGEFVREIVLIGDEKNYAFSVRPEYRKPKLSADFKDLDIKFKTLGFSTLIAEDLLQPGRYRVGIIFRDASGGSAFYRDKPVYYLVKTPNTLRFEK